MIVVKVELWSAITGVKTEIARSVIYNDGGTRTRGNYVTYACTGRDAEALSESMKKGPEAAKHKGRVENHARLEEHVWNLVAKALTAMGYGK